MEPSPEGPRRSVRRRGPGNLQLGRTQHGARALPQGCLAQVPAPRGRGCAAVRVHVQQQQVQAQPSAIRGWRSGPARRRAHDQVLLRRVTDERRAEGGDQAAAGLDPRHVRLTRRGVHVRRAAGDVPADERVRGEATGREALVVNTHEPDGHFQRNEMNHNASSTLTQAIAHAQSPLRASAARAVRPESRSAPSSAPARWPGCRRAPVWR